MNQAKNIKPENKPVLNIKEQNDMQDKKKYTTNEIDSTEANTKDGDLKPTNKISENIHIKPAEEQQFENEE